MTVQLEVWFQVCVLLGYLNGVLYINVSLCGLQLSEFLNDLNATRVQ